MKFVLFFFSFLSASAAYTQDNQLFVFGGINTSFLSTSLFRSIPRIGVVGGISNKYLGVFNSDINLITEFYWQQSGGSIAGSTYDYTSNTYSNAASRYKLRLREDTWNILCEYQFDQKSGDGENRFGIFAGPYFSFIGTSFFSSIINDYSNNNTSDLYFGNPNDSKAMVESASVKDRFWGFNYGLIFGVNKTISDFNFSIRYNMGLRSFTNMSAYTNEQPYSIKLNSVQFTVSYLIFEYEPLGRRGRYTRAD